jgi:hypothetical protein
MIPSPSRAGPVRGKPLVSLKPGSESVTVRRTRATVTWSLGHGPDDGTAPAAAGGSPRPGQLGVTASRWPTSDRLRRDAAAAQRLPGCPGHPSHCQAGSGSAASLSATVRVRLTHFHGGRGRTDSEARSRRRRVAGQAGPDSEPGPAVTPSRTESDSVRPWHGESESASPCHGGTARLSRPRGVRLACSSNGDRHGRRTAGGPGAIRLGVRLGLRLPPLSPGRAEPPSQ